MQTRQELLTQMYRSKLAQAEIEPELGRRLSCPLLISVPIDWETAARRIIIVGQETRNWGLLGEDAAGIAPHDIESYDDLIALPNLADAIDALIHTYDVSMSGSGGEYKPFFGAFGQLVRSTECDASLWSNLFWCSLDGGSVLKNLTPSDLDQIYRMQRGRLKREIEVLNPTAVVFFTGPCYDDALRDEFDDVQLFEVNDLPPRGFSRVVSSFLPEKSYRLYHPSYLRRRRHWEWLITLGQLVM